MPACCVCVGGVNYSISCACNPCGGNGLSMSTNNPNPAISQSVGGCGGCGGASSLSAALNAVGKWGTALTGVLQGKPVATNKSGVAVGAKGASALTSMSPNSMLLILLIVGGLIFLAMRK
jgi:hypothetical protein